MHETPRCGARTRAGTPCRSPAVKGKSRCRMHGGADGSGAPKGNTNAIKSGLYTKAAIAERKRLKAIADDAAAFLEDIQSSDLT
ncbi:MAG: HGGxSTG domain-containing protein [Henriciella sp.]